MRTRFAPSPTGDLHLGGAFTALGAWWLARSHEGRTVLRVEDLDRPRVVAGAEARQREDLGWLGLDWDEAPEDTGPTGPYRQSERTSLYDEALGYLTALGRTYPCDCSRAEIARVASAPHEGEEVPYPGTCRDKDPARSLKRPAAIRLRLDASDASAWVDGVAGEVSPRLLHATGDFVLRRGDGVYAYQLAVSVDDLAMRITDVVRGDDLLASTPRQLLLMQLLRTDATASWARDHDVPRYWHVPLVRDASGARLAKRTPLGTVRELRDAGIPMTTLVGHLAYGLGLQSSPAPASARDFLGVRRATFRKEPWPLPATWV